MFQEFPDDNMNDSFLSERRQKIAEQSVINNEDRKNDLKRSKSVFIGAVSGLALAGIVGWFALSPRYAAENVGEIPVVRRTQTAVKVLPSDPGGMEILNQDKTVYGIIDKSEPETAAVESILPPPEQPILPVIQAENNQLQPQTAPDQIGNIIEDNRVVTAAPVTVPGNAVSKSNPPAAVVDETPEIKLPTIKEAAEQQNRTAAANKETTAPKTVERPQPVAAVSQPAADILANIASSGAASSKKSASSGDWQIQLMSSPNKKAVESAWKSMVKKYPALNGQTHEVEAADLGSKGTYYRLKAGAFEDRAGADKLCNTLKKQGGSCIVKKK